MINLRGKKEREELLAIVSSLGLVFIKGGAAYWTGTLSLLASALDSLLDFLVSGVNLLTISLAQKQADADHNFGHEKVESLAGLLQALLIAGSAFYLIYASFHRLGHPSEIGHLPIGILIIGFSMFTSLVVSYRLRKTAAVTGSIVLKSDSLHYSMDLYSQGGILVALALIQLSGWRLLDPLVTIPVALYIAYQAYQLGREAADELMDREASPETLATVRLIVERHRPQVVGIHNFKTRRAGGKRFIQFHMEMQKSLSFEDVHELSERVVGEIRRELGNVQVIIHPDPEGGGLDQSDLA